MDLAAVWMFLLSQGDLPLEAHTQKYLDLITLVHYDEDSLCIFFHLQRDLEGASRSTMTGYYCSVPEPSKKSSSSVHEGFLVGYEGIEALSVLQRQR